jgi:hypothetical protein
MWEDLLQITDGTGATESAADGALSRVQWRASRRGIAGIHGSAAL